MALTYMETKFCKLPLDFEALLNEDVGNNHLASCNEIDSIDQFIELLISTAPGEHTFDKEFGCEIFYLDFESIVSHTRWEGQFSEYITKAITRYEKRLMMTRPDRTAYPAFRPSRNAFRYMCMALWYTQERSGAFIM